MSTAKALEQGPPHRILWLTDLSPRAAACQDAVRWFATLPTTMQGDDPAEVVVAHAMGPEAGEDPSFIEARRTEATAHVAALAGDLESVGIASQGVVCRGRPVDVTRTLVDEHEIDLVVCGRTGVNGIDKMLLGSTARRLVRELRVPILVVHSAAFAGPRRILCPVDPTEARQAAATEVGIRVASNLALASAARVEFLSVALVTGLVPEDLAEVTTHLHGRVEKVLAQHFDQGQRERLDRHSRVVQAPVVSTAVIDAARRADLVVLGSAGRTGLARLVLGSVAEDLVERSPVHTLVAH